MKNLAKLIVISVFGLGALVVFLGSLDISRVESAVLAMAAVTPTPVAANKGADANAPKPASPSNAAAVKPPTASADGKKMTKSFTLGKDSQSEYGEVAFDHDSHAFKNYSPDGKSLIGCAECHHTDQPKSALKPPLITSERDVLLTLESWKASPQKVNECRFCHFQAGAEIPEGKTMPSTTDAKGKTKELDNQLAYHINCNTCHDDAAKVRPALKGAPGFATSSDCTKCHKSN